MVLPDILYCDGMSLRVISADLRLHSMQGVVTILFAFACFSNKPENVCFLNTKDKESMAIRAEHTRIYTGREQIRRAIRLECSQKVVLS